MGTPAQNRANRGKDRDVQSVKYKGVSFHKRIKKWQAQIRANGRSVCLGYFSDPKDAAIAYDKAARVYQGNYAYLNFSGDQS